jgi:hypothetical protein
MATDRIAAGLAILAAPDGNVLADELAAVLISQATDDLAARAGARR